MLRLQPLRRLNLIKKFNHHPRYNLQKMMQQKTLNKKNSPNKQSLPSPLLLSQACMIPTGSLCVCNKHFSHSMEVTKCLHQTTTNSNSISILIISSLWINTCNLCLLWCNQFTTSSTIRASYRVKFTLIFTLSRTNFQTIISFPINSRSLHSISL